MRVLQPQGWPRPKGYANGMAARGELVFTAGVVGWDAEEKFPAGMVAQFRQTLENIVAILAEAGAGPEHIVRLTCYITDRQAYLDNVREIGAAYRDVIGRHFPTMAVIQVVALMEADAMVEIEATAVKPD